ncbi:MAG: hypothetical protein CVU73_12295 [Deltaproteobacteria bacterium HGW-Deltaproteobacteria-8]|jgi:hypothetical protein|nr:MAG: hypothetical protein CVU73_12295 [Deltaproteobacteria bacterium HGW-Deltaproteobacteria-8]
MPKPNRPLPLTFLPVLLMCLLVLFAVATAWAESTASARLRALADTVAADQNATVEEQAASRSLTRLLAEPSTSSEATGKAALALSEMALGQGRTDTASNLAEAVLDLVANNSSGTWGVLAGRAKNLLAVAGTVREAYAASSAASPASLGDALPYVNSAAFDRKLSSSLAERPASFEVLCPLPVSMKKLPERLDKWLSAIEKSGGKVEAVPVAEARSLFTDLLELALKLYDLVAGRDLYAPAQYYNATVYYKRSTATVVKVVFTLR